MAKDISTTTGIGTDADFLNGNIVDEQTVAGEIINQDMVQFFQKLMSLAGLTPNGDFDNEANGYQFVTALKAFNKYYNENYDNGAAPQGAAGTLVLGKDGHITITSAGKIETDKSINVVGSGQNCRFPSVKLGDTPFNFPLEGMGADGEIASGTALGVWKNNNISEKAWTANGDGDSIQDGNVEFGGKAVGDNAPKICALIGSAGSVINQVGSVTISSSNTGTGLYSITGSGFTATNILTGTTTSGTGGITVDLQYFSTTEIRVRLVNTSGALVDSGFSVVGYW